ncbi:MAG: YebC/PmpR family DNA-binding transcriptional regulator [Sumerlaeia bacterium]
MSGHSKWHSIKHKKAAIDAKRGKVFTKVIKELQIASRLGGSDPDSNPRLRTAIQAAKDVNMPKDTMERAIKKGAGELEGNAFEEITYEGYAPGAVAVMVMVTTDNRNRAAAEVRHIFNKYGGSMGQSGSVAYMFERKGIIEAEDDSDDAVMEAAIEAGAEDVRSDDGYHEIVTEPDTVQECREALESAGVKVTSSSVQMVASTKVEVGPGEALKLAKFLGILEDNDDVDDVYTNHTYSEEAQAVLEES